MSTYLCPKGHNSTEPDYCSECGARIQGSSDPSLSPTPPSSQPKSGLTCPDCATLHEPNSGDFCEICGYNFVSGAHGEVPIAVSHPPVLDPIKLDEEQPQTQKQETIEPNSLPSSSLPRSPAPLTWEITVAIAAVAPDPASPTPPDNFTPFSVRLVEGNNLIGRTSQVRAIHPEIPLDFDDAVSHRHALLNLNPDGTLTLRDIGSSNGTKLNNVEVKPMVDALLKSGDEITLGHWIRIKVAGN